MYLHLGQGVVVRQRDIIGIFDMDNTTVSRYSRGFLNKAEKGNRVTYVSMDLPKSYVVCAPQKQKNSASAERQDRVYVAQMAPATLRKRHLLMGDMSKR